MKRYVFTLLMVVIALVVASHGVSRAEVLLEWENQKFQLHSTTVHGKYRLVSKWSKTYTQTDFQVAKDDPSGGFSIIEVPQQEMRYIYGQTSPIDSEYDCAVYIVYGSSVYGYEASKYAKKRGLQELDQSTLGHHIVLHILKHYRGR